MAFAKRPVRPAAPQTGLDPVITKLTTLGLDHPAAVLPELIEQAARNDLSPLTFLDLLLTSQLERKDERRIATMLKLSGLPPGKTLEGFDWGFQPKAECRQIDLLATCQYLRDKTNVLFLGPPGVGKSHCEYSGSLSRAKRVEATVQVAAGGMTRKLIGHAVGARAFA